jgi:RimJ/RimL family protein N-acetyltransferase
MDRYAAEWTTTDRLTLREPTRDEVVTVAAELAAHYNEPVNRALMTNESDHSPEDVVEHYDGMWSAGDTPFFLFLDGALVGDCDLRHVKGGAAEFAILVGPRATQGKGLGTRFSVMALVLAFGPMGLSRVYAAVRPENAGSLRMFAKVGYEIDASEAARAYAEADDDVCFSIDAARFRTLHEAALREVRVSTRPR